MKHTAGHARPRRLAAPQKKVRLDLQRRPKPEPDDELGAQQKSHFWKWVVLVALLHVVVISTVYFIYETASAPKPPDAFISLLPPGDVVKGTAGAQEAHKLGATTPAPAAHHAPAPPPTPAVQPKPVTPPPVAVAPPQPAPKPTLKTDAPPVAQDKPIPKPPKVKVDLHLADGPAPVTKPKPHPPKPVAKNADDNSDAASKPDSAGLSKEQIAAKLGEKMDASGVKNALKPGTSGSVNSHANPFADFYASIRDQVMSQWESPNLTDETAVNPVVQIYVEKDGRVPAESVHLIRSSGNPTYDDSAVAAAKNLGYLHQPLPDGCPPDIPITFKLTR